MTSTRRAWAPLVFAALALAACSDPSEDETEGATDGSGGADGTEDSGAASPARTPPPYSGGACPTLVEGSQEFATGDTTYQVRVVLPDDPEEAPVLFAWHWLGGSAGSLISSLDLDELAREQGVIVVAPESDGSRFEWHFAEGPEGNPDLLMFEDLLSCAHATWAVDLDRIYATGMSAGGLMTAYVTVYESDWLAATAPLSGGASPYVSPEEPLPVMITWGGPGDTYGGGAVRFEDLSLELSEGLQADGHFVVECVHSRGHTLPPWGIGPVWRFLSAHPKDATPSPWADGLPSDMPSDCALP